MNKIIFIALAVMLIVGCRAPELNYEAEVRVVYVNGEVDTLILKTKKRSLDSWKIYITADGACLMSWGNRRELVACGVRKFYILSKKEVKTTKP